MLQYFFLARCVFKTELISITLDLGHLIFCYFIIEIMDYSEKCKNIWKTQNPKNQWHVLYKKICKH